MKGLDAYNAARLSMNEYFGYQERWRVLPYEDERDMYWLINCDEVIYHEEADVLKQMDGNQYSACRYCSEWIYRGADFTALAVDTHCDGNVFLMVFDNAKEVKP